MTNETKRTKVGDGEAGTYVFNQRTTGGKEPQTGRGCIEKF